MKHLRPKAVPILSKALAIAALSFSSSTPLLANDSPPVVNSPAETSTLAAELPNPLTLDFVLSAPSELHPQLLNEQAKLNRLQAQQQSLMATDALQLNLVGRLGWREYAEESEDHHLAALHLRKSLYDFDRTRLQAEAFELKGQAQQGQFHQASAQLQLQLMQAYFNVLLADFQFRIDNEAMAIAYIRFDKAKDRLDLQRISDVDFLQAEQNYEKVRVKRTRSEYNQLQTRLQLANLMGWPQARPDELTLPKFKALAKRDIKSLQLETLQQQVLNENPDLKSLEVQLQAANLDLQSQQASGKPSLALEAWAGQLSSYPEIREGRWKVGLTLDVPLVDGGAVDAAVSEAKAEMQSLQAQKSLIEQTLREQVADLFFQLKMLKAEEGQHLVFGDYADLYLDYSRALYENETATDLGDAMVRLSQANYNQIEWQFKRALLWAQLDVLLGKVPTESIYNPLLQDNPQGKES